MLNLSRISRASVRDENFSLTQLAKAVVSDLQSRDPGRQVTVEIQPDLQARGDARLVNVALENLIGNAWKFTSKQPDAKIVLGQENKDGENVFYIRDNGAGFDMTYSDKLFGAFQRLHSDREFEGTGIGLATVQRIIHRHGGRIWAEAAPGQGATFFFTLGGNR